jgi:hypothetical protein
MVAHAHVWSSVKTVSCIRVPTTKGCCTRHYIDSQLLDYIEIYQHYYSEVVFVTNLQLLAFHLKNLQLLDNCNLAIFK